MVLGEMIRLGWDLNGIGAFKMVMTSQNRWIVLSWFG